MIRILFVLLSLLTAFTSAAELTYLGNITVEIPQLERNTVSREPIILQHADSSRLIVHSEFGDKSQTREIVIPADPNAKIAFSTPAIPSPVVAWQTLCEVPGTGGKTLAQKNPSLGRMGGVAVLPTGEYLCNFWVFYHNDGKPYSHIQRARYDGKSWGLVGMPIGPPEGHRFIGPRGGRSTTLCEGTITPVDGGYLVTSSWYKDTQPLITKIVPGESSYTPTQYLTGKPLDDCLEHATHGGFIHNGIFYWLERSGFQGWYGAGDMQSSLNPKHPPGPLNYPDVWEYSNKGYHASGEHGYTLWVRSIPLVELAKGNTKAIVSQEITKYVLNRKKGSPNMGASAGKEHVQAKWGPLVKQGNRIYSAEWKSPSLHVHVFEVPK